MKFRMSRGGATAALAVAALALTACAAPCPEASSHPRASSASRRLQPILDELSSLRGRLLLDDDLTADARTQLVLLTDRIRGALGLMLVRLRTALSKSSVLPSFGLSMLAVYLCYGHREEPADHAFLSIRRCQTYRGVAQAA